MLVACGAQPRPWGAFDVGPGQPVVLGVATTGANQPAPTSPGLEDISYDPPDQVQPIAGHPIEQIPVPFDCAAQPALARTTGVPLPEAVTGLLGPPCSSGCIYMQSQLFDRRTTMVAPACTAAAVVRQGYPVAFRLSWNDDDQAALAARFARDKLGAHTAVVVLDTTVFGRSLTNRFTHDFDGRGRTVSQVVVQAQGQVDEKALARSIDAIRPDVIAVFIGRDDAADIFRSLSDGYRGVPMVAADTVLVSTGQAGNAAGLCGVDVTGAVTSCSIDSAAAQRFVCAGLARDGRAWVSELDAGSALGSALAGDALAVYVAALRRVAQPRPDGSLLIPKQALRNAIANTKMTGASGRIDFDSAGERRHDVGAALYKVDAGGITLVDELRR